MANIDFPKGGPTVSLKTSAGPQTPGQSAQLGRSSDKFAKGGSTIGTIKTSAGPQVAGQSASLGRSSDKFPSGGKGGSVGKTASNAARAR